MHLSKVSITRRVASVCPAMRTDFVVVLLWLMLSTSAQVHHERLYPLTPSQDTFIHGETVTFYQYDYLEVGRRNDGLNSHILLRFNVSDFIVRSQWGSEELFGNLNRSSLQNATLRLSCVNVRDDIDANAKVFTLMLKVSEILLPWDQSSVTSLTRNQAGDHWTATGLDIGGLDATAAIVNLDASIERKSCQRGRTFVLDITRIFASWLDDPQSNHGILIWTEFLPGVETTLKLASVESAYVEKHPQIRVSLQDSIIDPGVSCPNNDFACLDGSCIDMMKVCNFVADCLHGNDEQNCGIQCDFEEPCPWTTPPVSNSTPGWQVHSGPTGTAGTGPPGGLSETGTSDFSSNYIYVDASVSTTGTRSHLISPLYAETGPQCTLHFNYYMHGQDIGSLRLTLDFTALTREIIWEKFGSQDDRWLGDVVPLGSFKEPFHIRFEVERGGGEIGDVAIDSLKLIDCSPDLTADPCPAVRYYKCDNLACIMADRLCDGQKDCLLGEDENVDKCAAIPFGGFCSFEQESWCGWQNIDQSQNLDDFDWSMHSGKTKTAKTGPSVDHTLGTDQGHYIYTEASGRLVTNEAHLRSVWFPPPPPLVYESTSPYYHSCKVRFFYHMYGDRIGRLQLFIVRNISSDLSHSQVFSASSDKGDVWNSVIVELPTIKENYYLQFESMRFNSYQSDIALDDISLSRPCFHLDNATFDMTTSAPTKTAEVVTSRKTESTSSDIPIPTQPLSDQSLFMFTTCRATGEAGPTQSQCSAAYRDDNVTVSVQGGIQKWIVPESRTYNFQVRGAGGGTGVENSSPSHGAKVDASFTLTKGEELHLLVGQQGEDACHEGGVPGFGAKAVCTVDLTEMERQRFGAGGNLAGGGGGGGGASFVALWNVTSSRYLPLLVAGGGGGLSFSLDEKHDEGVHGSVERPGPGTPGKQGSFTNNSGAGGGWNESSSSSSTQASGRTFLQGGLGGSECALAHIEADWRTKGGFGGGGGACTSGGGGGGYTGGDAPLEKTLYGNGQGGTSFVHPSGFDVKKTAGENPGFGEVIVTAVVRCPSGQIPSDDFRTCVSIPPAVLHLAMIIGCLAALVIVVLCLVIVVVIAYRCKKKKRKLNISELNQSTVSLDYQLNELRHRAAIDVNPCYLLGEDALTVKDLKELPRENLKLVSALGQGAFGEVYYGLFQLNGNEEAIDVAVKTLPARSNEHDETEFLMEALILANFDHPNIVALQGVCFTKSPHFILLEYMAGGELKQFLRDSRPKRDHPSSIDMSDLLTIAYDVTKGCDYLESRRFIHRDIAARNILLSSKGRGRISKIGDFGMARDIYSTDYYRKGGKAVLPVKWMPPEAFLDGIFTSKTDVWSFGVLLWEIISLGYMPYPGMNNQEVIHFVTGGGRMTLPRNCPKPIQDVMTDCWQHIASLRPAFAIIMQRIGDCLQDSEVLNSPLPKGNHNDGANLLVIRRGDPKISPVLKVNRPRNSRPSRPSEDEYLTPDWIPGTGGHLEDQLLLDRRNANNNSGENRSSGGGKAAGDAACRGCLEDDHKTGTCRDESIKRLRMRQGLGELTRHSSDVVYSSTPPMEEIDLATEASSLLYRQDSPMDEAPRHLLNRSSSNHSASHSRRPDHSDATAVSAVAAVKATTDINNDIELSPRLLNRFRLPVFSRHSSFEVPRSDTQADPGNTSLPMLNRMQSLPVTDNAYLEMGTQPARSTPDNSQVTIGSSNVVNDEAPGAANRRCRFTSQPGQVVFEEGEEHQADVV